MNLTDLIGALLGFMFTLVVLSYIIGDNPLFRLAIHIFIGVSAGFAAIMAINNVLLPRLFLPLLNGSREERLLALAPLILGWLLLTKVSQRLSRWGNISMAYLVGVGAAVAIGGTVTGTLIPQLTSSVNLFDLNAVQGSGVNLIMQLTNASIVLVGTISTLAYFHFGVRSRPEPTMGWRTWFTRFGQVGQFFIAIAFGVLFAGVYSAALLALIERLHFLVDFMKTLLLPS